MAYEFSAPPSLDQAKVEFISAFYRTSDSRDVDQYLNFLTSDVDFIMGLNAVKGEAAVRKIRETMWGGVETRAHNPEKAFENGNEVMLHGTVSYGLKNGEKVEHVGWAAKMVFAEGSELKLSRYQDGTPLSTALKKQAEQQ
ncbi:nuclear transport factor 2 family protein [Sporobolomyces salmoneus]|uniref:nuclear transport factor 2 family protein n=1 Tax=Sporobolomyces salmoneus TaxID=183962 RepID=UPI00317B12AF